MPLTTISQPVRESIRKRFRQLSANRHGRLGLLSRLHRFVSWIYGRQGTSQRAETRHVLSSSFGLAVVGISLNREWRAGRPSCGRRDGIFIGLNIGKPPIRNAIPAPLLRCAEENHESGSERKKKKERGDPGRNYSLTGRTM